MEQKMIKNVTSYLMQFDKTLELAKSLSNGDLAEIRSMAVSVEDIDEGQRSLVIDFLDYEIGRRLAAPKKRRSFLVGGSQVVRTFEFDAGLSDDEVDAAALESIKQYAEACGFEGWQPVEY